ncbi:alpha-L-arabinofuranosidase B [Kitasatospora xanthocidica]|uniref:alpha-L-arabinofuranosidase B n=1 Tax=Kitasatospora xanthocidica TaxID=83382 RepID=UPI0036E58EA2
MIKRSWIRRVRRAILATGTTAVLAAGLLTATATTSQAAAQGPYDIYAAGGTPCVTAHSTTRALYGAYNGPLYQVRRASDGTTKDIGLLSTGGYANAPAQDSFCAATSCVITVIYDQSGKGNSLTQALKGSWPGPAAGGNDNLANAFEAPVTVAGHEAYGVYIAPGTGYRNNHTNGIATRDQPEGMYAIFDGTHFNGGCCFDYGNAETSGTDTGNGHMEAIYFGNNTGWGRGSGNGPWVMADLENGLFSGVNRGLNAGDPSINDRFVTAIVKGEPNHWAIRTGNAQSGGLSTGYSGPRPSDSGYNPMHKEGSIILGIGGDNSNGSAGTFYEGVMTSGYPSDATENAVQANITAAGYNSAATSSGSLRPGSRISLQATTAPCCTSHYLRHDDADARVVISAIDSSSSATDKADASWIVRAGLADTSCLSFESADSPGQFLRHYAFELYLNTDDGGSDFAQDATFCPTSGNSGGGKSFQSVNYPTKYIRHYGYTGYVASNGGSNAWDSATSWAADTSWLVDQPWG